MPQHDQVLSNGPGVAVRSDINAALAAIFSSSSGGSEPSVKQAGMLWFDNSVGILKLRDATNAVWLNMMSSAQYSSVNGTVTVPVTPGAINTWTKVNISTLGNNVGGWTLSSGMLVAPIAGIYSVTASASTTQPTVSAMYVGIGVNSSTGASRTTRIFNAYTSAVLQSFSVTGQVALAAGGTLALMVNQSALSSVTVGADATFLSASLISPT